MPKVSVKGWSQHVFTRDEWRVKTEDRITALLDVVPVCHPRDKYMYSVAKQMLTFFPKQEI